MDGQRIGAQIEHFRKLAGLSKSDLARRVRVSPTAVQNWETNGVVPRMETMIALERALEVDLMQLLTGREGMKARAAEEQPATNQPEVGRRERLDQFKRQIAALFDVPPDRVEIVIRT